MTTDDLTTARLDVPVADVLEQLRQSLPLDDPDRHALDTVADGRFARLAPGCPETAVTS